MLWPAIQQHNRAARRMRMAQQFRRDRSGRVSAGREGLIRGYTTTYFMFFSKCPASQAARSKYAGRVRFLDVNERYGRSSYDE